MTGMRRFCGNTRATGNSERSRGNTTELRANDDAPAEFNVSVGAWVVVDAGKDTELDKQPRLRCSARGGTPQIRREPGAIERIA